MKNFIALALSLIFIGNAKGSAIPIPAQNKQSSQAQSATAGKLPPPAPKTQVAAKPTLTPSMIYTASSLRDPFRKASSGSSSSPQRPFKLADFNIHNLILQGLMVGKKTGFALLIDANYGAGFILKGNKIYNSKGKAIPGVTGHIDPRRKTVYLKARDGDVQVLRMKGEKR